MCDGPIEIFECIWVNIWCMLDLFRHKTEEILSFCIQLVNQCGAQNLGRFLYIQLGIRHTLDGVISDCESWDIRGSWFAKRTEEKKGGYHSVVWIKREKVISGISYNATPSGFLRALKQLLLKQIAEKQSPGDLDTKFQHKVPLLLEWGEEIHFSCVCEVETVLSLFIFFLTAQNLKLFGQK